MCPGTLRNTFLETQNRTGSEAGWPQNFCSELHSKVHAFEAHSKLKGSCPAAFIANLTSRRLQAMQTPGRIMHAREDRLFVTCLEQCCSCSAVPGLSLGLVDPESRSSCLATLG